ncbi:hypothetical protein ACFSKL_04210 [Belliella marina]|uniref:Uncharacterized protein n=1 Tax=Belliella marina TaxID=1644146 RepID=A0ABW4VIR0_9BACT
MWQPLQNADQLEIGSRLRQVILDGNFQHESIYHVERTGDYYFLARIVEQDGEELPEERQTVAPYRTAGIIHYGFEIWTD